VSAAEHWIEEADGVFRGGGVKGIALAGALEGFARHPTKPVTKWVNVAGASAGAIIACYLAAGHDAAAMTKLLADTRFGKFADFPLGLKPLGFARLPFRHGMARGKAFESWFEEVLEEATFGKFLKTAGDGTEEDWRLKLIAVDVTQKRLLVLPEDLAGYSTKSGEKIDPNTFSVARAARMSMSIPYFFEPVELVNGEGRISTIVDGGTLSNFPVWLFDVDSRPPRRPTFGFTLTGGRGLGAGGLAGLTPWPVRFGIDIFQTAREAWDTRFASHSTHVRTLAVDAADVGTTEFDLSEAKQRLLRENGIKAATVFLDGFDLSEYMNTYAGRLAQPPRR
jgi:NTE family protein